MALIFVSLIAFRAVFVLSNAPKVQGQNNEEVSISDRTLDDVDSQNIEVLDSSMVYKRGVAIGGGDIDIVEESALIAQIGPEGTGADIVAKNRTSDEISLYEVKEGDTLGEIAEMFGVSPNTIIWANNMSSRTVNVGSVLIILPVTGISHEVKSGDTISSIAKKYDADLIEVARYNDRDTDTSLSVGEVIIVPYGEISTPASKRVARSSESTSSGYYMKPVNGRKTQGIHGYNAVDIGAPTGTPVYAAASGKVIISKWGGWNGGYGNYVVIKHDNGTQTLYSHMSRNNVGVGEWVGQGQLVGAVGSTGRSTGPHLHFEIRGASNPF